MSETEIGIITASPNALVLAPTGVQRWAPVFDSIVIDERPDGGRILRILVADQTAAQFDLSAREARHLAGLLFSSAI